MNIVFIIFLIGVLLYILKIKKPLNFSDNITDYLEGQNLLFQLTETQKNNANDVKDFADNNNLFYYCNLAQISYSLALSVLMNESSGEILNGKFNSEIIGDGGNSVGYFQVSNPAINDVNNTYNKNFTKQSCLENKDDNFTVGCLYLKMCIDSALNENATNTIKVSFKKYNGGIDESESSINLPASAYANKAFEYYKYFHSILTD